MRPSLFRCNAKALLAVATVGAGALMASGANASMCSPAPVFNAPGVPAAGFPDFRNSNVSVSLTGKTGSGFVLTATATSPGTFCLGNNTYSISSETFKMTALFSNSGTFESGSESIYGYIPGLTSNSVQDLFSDSLTSYGVSTSTAGLGFETASDPTGWASQYQSTDESLYLYGLLAKLISGDLSAGLSCGKNCIKSVSISASPISAITTVPLPAAIWLLGAGVAGLLAVGRRRREAGSEVLGAASV
jgi:hypothetical protein